MSDVDLAGLVPALATAPPSQLVATMDHALAPQPWYTACRLLVADYGDRVLVDVGAAGEVVRPTDALAIAYRTCRMTIAGSGADTSVLVPLRVRADCIGVLEFRVDGVPPDGGMAALEALGHVVAQVLHAGKHQSDFVERRRRVQPMSLSAEIQWDLLSARAQAGPGYSAAGWMEPAYDVGGDTFDIAVDVGVLWISSIDAMGHGLHAGVTSGLTISAVRNARREGGGVADQAAAANEALLRLWEGERFATVLLLRVDLATGEVEAVNAGHPPARRLSGTAVETLRLAVDVPPGLAGNATYRAQRFTLAPGDRLVALSDGVTAAAVDGGAPYGDERIDRDLAAMGGRTAAEVVRTVGWQVLSHAGDRLRDDATIVCLDWEGGHGR